MESLSEITQILTVNYLSQKLSDWFNEECVYTGFTYSGGTGKGDSYLSDVYRLIIHGTKEKENAGVEVQVILKSLPKNIARCKSFRCTDFFRNEINFYDKILTELLKFQSEKSVSDPFDHYARVFASHTDGENDFLVLEDLSVDGYGGPARQKGIDFDHCGVIIRTLAKFHALSMAFKDQNPAKFEEIASSIAETYYHDSLWWWHEKYWKQLCVCAIDTIEKEYPDTKYVEKIKDFASDKTYFRMAEAASNSKRHGVIGHGDMWTTNFLVKYSANGSKPIHGKLIDFQLTRHASPILDLSFFVYACTEKELRMEHFDSILKIYHEKLCQQLQDLGTDPLAVYPWDVFMDEMKKYSFLGLGFSLESTPFIVLEPEDAKEVENLEGTDIINVADIFKMEPIKTKAGRLREANNIVHAVDMDFI